MLVLDANILIRAVLGRRVRGLLEQYSALGVQFFAPDAAFSDALEYLPLLLAKRDIHDIDPAAALGYLETLVQSVELDSYSLFEAEARSRLRGRDEEDWPVLASALAFHCAIWTEDTDFFGTGAAVWTTNRVQIYLDAATREESQNRE
jgi:predicted nucleic acid-binding protein